MALRISTLRGAVLLTVVAVFLVLLLASGVGAQSAPIPTGTHRVAAGETLWTIAESMTPPGGDVREVVFSIKRLNELDSSLIRPGEILVVPAG